MGKVKQITIKNRTLNRTYYFWDDMINLKNFKWNLLKIDKKSYKNIDIYNIGYIKFGGCENIYSANPSHLLVNHASRYIEEKNGSIYLIFDSADENKVLPKKYTDVWDGIKNEIRTINGGKENDYEKNYMKIKFNSDDDLPLNKPLQFHSLTIIIRSVFEEGGKLYPQVFLDNNLYELNVWNARIRQNRYFRRDWC